MLFRRKQSNRRVYLQECLLVICVCLTKESIEQNAEIIDRYDGVADVFELRYDMLSANEKLPEIRTLTKTPVVFTIRLPEDGGARRLDPDYFLSMYEKAVDCGFSYIDLHLPGSGQEQISKDGFGRVVAKARKHGVNVIRSLHFMNGQPEDIENEFSRLEAADGDIPKLAVRPKNCRDLLQIFKLADSRRNSDKIILGMGDYGFSTRVLTKRLGSMWTYTSPDDGTAAAPGHISPETLQTVYKYEYIKEPDGILCVIGNPVLHSKSPFIHNTALRKKRLPFVYVPFTVDNLHDFMELAGYLKIKGVSVTVPYKEKVPAYCDGVSEAVQFTGACNTLVNDEGVWRGYNTDIDGFMIPFKDFVKRETLAGMLITVIGAGGGGKGVAYGLKKAGAELLIVNRTVEKAESLARSISSEYGDISSASNEKISKYSDAVVQTTNCGMKGFENLDPLKEYTFSGRENVFDIVYTPAETVFLKRAKEAGCRIENGERMLLEQAKVQFRLFTGCDFD